MKFLKSLELNLSNINLMTVSICLLALWSIVIQDGLINRDGLMYVKQAYLFSEGRWDEGIKVFNWPFFGAIIFLTSKVTNLSFQYSAHLINLILFAIAVIFYLKVLLDVYLDKRIVFYGGLLLISFIPLMDDYVGMILRDHGLWAASMAGTYFYIKYLRTNSFKYNLTWQSLFLFGTLFRPESFVFLISIPLIKSVVILFEQKETLNFRDIIKELYLALLLFGGLIILFLINNSGQSILPGRFNEFIPKATTFLNQLASPLPINSTNKYLSEIINYHSFAITISVMFAVIISKWLSGIGFLRFLLLVYYFKNKKPLIKNKNLRYTIYSLIIINIFLTTINFFNIFVFSNRYLENQWFLIFIIISPILMKFFYLKNKGIKILFFKIVAIFYIIFSILVSMYDIQRANIEVEAGKYIANLNISDEVSVVHSDRVAYYGGIDLAYITNYINLDANPEWIIYTGNSELPNRLVNIEYQLERKFIKTNDNGIYILKRRI